MNVNSLKFVFFGTPKFALLTLELLARDGYYPALVVTSPDAREGRHLKLTPPPVKVWAEENNIPVLQPEKLDEDFCKKLSAEVYDLFIVSAYGKIIPKNILEIPKHGSLNVHPSLLPKFRGPSPIESAILEDGTTGVSIMLLDEEMDHGPIVAQDEVVLKEEVWPPYFSKLEEELAILGGRLLVATIPRFIADEISPQEQDHAKATFTKKIKKEDGLLNLNGDPKLNFRKVRAFAEWPRAHFFQERKGKKMRVIATKAALEDGKLILKKVIPEGGKEMSYEEFLRGV